VAYEEKIPNKGEIASAFPKKLGLESGKILLYIKKPSPAKIRPKLTLSPFLSNLPLDFLFFLQLLHQ